MLSSLRIVRIEGYFYWRSTGVNPPQYGSCWFWKNSATVYYLVCRLCWWNYKEGRRAPTWCVTTTSQIIAWEKMDEKAATLIMSEQVSPRLSHLWYVVLHLQHQLLWPLFRYGVNSSHETIVVLSAVVHDDIRRCDLSQICLASYAPISQCPTNPLELRVMKTHMHKWDLQPLLKCTQQIQLNVNEELSPPRGDISTQKTVHFAAAANMYTFARHQSLPANLTLANESRTRPAAKW